MDAPKRQPLLHVDDVSVSYRSTIDVGMTLRDTLSTKLSGRRIERVPAVTGVTFDLHDGEVLGIVGSNGAGKSTLLTAISGLLPVDSGSIRAASNPVLLGVGAALRNSISGRRNIRIGLLALGFSGQRLDSLTEQIVEFSAIGSAIDRPMSTYSSGMRARVNFGIATSISPQILLVDEALAVGDKEFKSKSYARIEALRDRAGAVILVSHSLSEVRRVCSRVIWLDQGRVLGDGPTEEILERYEAS